MRSLTTNRPFSSRFLFILGWLTVLVVLSPGCMTLQVRHPLPEHLLAQAQVADLPGIQAWGDKKGPTPLYPIKIFIRFPAC